MRCVLPAHVLALILFLLKLCIIFKYFKFQIGGFWVVFVGVGGFMIIISICMCLFLPSNQGKSSGIKKSTALPAGGPFEERMAK